mmetsp:Transcript_97608/g.284934  ORF Transcript_97608/g.284934 Transcript_97608/m.284934 type:complete len:221 (+) Transcript_97608:233-895(+)
MASVGGAWNRRHYPPIHWGGAATDSSVGEASWSAPRPAALLSCMPASKSGASWAMPCVTTTWRDNPSVSSRVAHSAACALWRFSTFALFPLETTTTMPIATLVLMLPMASMPPLLPSRTVSCGLFASGRRCSTCPLRSARTASAHGFASRQPVTRMVSGIPPSCWPKSHLANSCAEEKYKTSVYPRLLMAGCSFSSARKLWHTKICGAEARRREPDFPPP